MKYPTCFGSLSYHLVLNKNTKRTFNTAKGVNCLLSVLNEDIMMAKWAETCSLLYPTFYVVCVVCCECVVL